MNKKWIIYIVLIVVAFVLIVVFSKNIYFWLSNQLEDSAPRGRFRRRLAAGTLRRQEKRDAARQRQLSDSKL